MPTRSSCLPPGLWTAPSPLTPSLLASRAFLLLTAPDVQDVLALHTTPAHLLLSLGLCILSLLRGPSSTHSHPSHSPSPVLFFFSTFSCIRPHVMHSSGHQFTASHWALRSVRQWHLPHCGQSQHAPSQGADHKNKILCEKQCSSRMQNAQKQLHS